VGVKWKRKRSLPAQKKELIRTRGEKFWDNPVFKENRADTGRLPFILRVRECMNTSRDECVRHKCRPSTTALWRHIVPGKAEGKAGAGKRTQQRRRQCAVVGG